MCTILETHEWIDKTGSIVLTQYCFVHFIHPSSVCTFLFASHRWIFLYAIFNWMGDATKPSHVLYNRWLKLKFFLYHGGAVVYRLVGCESGVCVFVWCAKRVCVFSVVDRKQVDAHQYGWLYRSRCAHVPPVCMCEWYRLPWGGHRAPVLVRWIDIRWTYNTHRARRGVDSARMLSAFHQMAWAWVNSERMYEWVWVFGRVWVMCCAEWLVVCGRAMPSNNVDVDGFAIRDFVSNCRLNRKPNQNSEDKEDGSSS